MGKGQSKQKKIDKFQREHPEGRKAYSKAKKAKRKPRKFNDQAKRIATKIERRKLNRNKRKKHATQ